MVRERERERERERDEVDFINKNEVLEHSRFLSLISDSLKNLVSSRYCHSRLLI